MERANTVRMHKTKNPAGATAGLQELLNTENSADNGDTVGNAVFAVHQAHGGS